MLRQKRLEIIKEFKLLDNKPYSQWTWAELKSNLSPTINPMEGF